MVTAVVNASCSTWRTVASAGGLSALGLVLFTVFVSGLEEAREGAFVNVNHSEGFRQVGATVLGEPGDIQ